jgi:hypothetical protein
MLFTIMVGKYVILRQNGVFRQAELYSYGDQVFAKYGSGYVGLRKPNSSYPTTKPDVTWLPESLDFKPTFKGQIMVVTNDRSLD